MQAVERASLSAAPQVTTSIGDEGEPPLSKSEELEAWTEFIAGKVTATAIDQLLKANNIKVSSGLAKKLKITALFEHTCQSQ